MTKCAKMDWANFARSIFLKRMKTMKRRISALLLVLVLICSLSVIPAGALSHYPAFETTILFTHDLHSHFLPQPAEDGGESGGYARLKTAIDAEKEKYPDALLLDGGDFSIGSLIQTLYTTQAAELRTMGALGYDATTIGNHEFDHTGTGFAEMLTAAVESRDTVPAVLEANYRPADSNPDKDFIQKAMDNYGVQETVLLERGNVTYGIFGLVGVDADECAPTSGFAREDTVQAAKRCVTSLKEQGAQFIICLSHSGTGDSLETSEDEELAKAVDGIDVILSGHTHSTLTEPLVVNNTYIVSAGPYCQNLGSITLLKYKDASGSKELLDYHLTPIDETLAEDPDTAAMVETWKTKVGETYLSRYGLTYDQVLTTTDFDLNTPASGIQQGNNLGNLVSDAFLWAVENLEADAPDMATVSVTADGVLRAPLRTGELIATQAFDVLSMGVGADGTSGFPLVAVYLSGKELKAAAEVDASVTPIMPAAQLYMGGMEYSFNTHRMFFNRVTDARLYPTSFSDGSQSGAAVEIEDDQLYRVVTGMYSAQMLGTVKDKSMGLLSLEPKLADGSTVTDFNDCILYDKGGNEIKEWYALAAYLQSFGKDGVPEQYAPAQGDGRKTVSRSWSPAWLLTNWNWITWVVVLAALVIILVIVLLVRLIVHKVRRRRDRKCK